MPDPEVERERVEALERWKAERDSAAASVPWPVWPRPPDTLGEHRSRDDRGGEGRRHGEGRRAAGGLRRSGPPASARRPRAPTGDPRLGSRTRRRGLGAAWPPESASWLESPGSTGTRTGPSRSPSAPATWAWRSSTRGSAFTPEQHPRPPRETRTSTWWACRSSPAPIESSFQRPSACCVMPASTCRSWSAGSSRPPARHALLGAGVARVYTPKHFDLNSGSWAEIADLVNERARAAVQPA